MKLEIISMTPQERMYSYSQSSQIEAQTGCIGHLRGDLALAKSFSPHGLSIVESTRPTSSRRSLMKWSTACGRKTGCFSAGTA